MAYKKTDREVLLSVEKGNANCMELAKLKADDNSVSYDIRNKFKTDNDEWAFTKQGVRINEETTIDVVKAILFSLPLVDVEDIIKDVQEKFMNKIN